MQSMGVVIRWQRAWLLTVGWVKKLLSSDVSKVSLRARPGLDALF